jgi:hypothetical protein
MLFCKSEVRVKEGWWNFKELNHFMKIIEHHLFIQKEDETNYCSVDRSRSRGISRYLGGTRYGRTSKKVYPRELTKYIKNIKDLNCTMCYTLTTRGTYTGTSTGKSGRNNDGIKQ